MCTLVFPEYIMISTARTKKLLSYVLPFYFLSFFVLYKRANNAEVGPQMIGFFCKLLPGAHITLSPFSNRRRQNRFSVTEEQNHENLNGFGFSFLFHLKYCLLILLQFIFTNPYNFISIVYSETHVHFSFSSRQHSTWLTVSTIEVLIDFNVEISSTLNSLDDT